MKKKEFNRATKEYELPLNLEGYLCAEEKKEEKKKMFRIACDWSVYSTMWVRAHSLEEAIKIAEDNEDLPTDTEYIDASFQINEEMTNHFCEEDSKKEHKKLNGE